MTENPEPTIETLAETENYQVWKVDEPDGETTYNVQINFVTLNFFTEEWAEFLELVSKLVK